MRSFSFSPVAICPPPAFCFAPSVVYSHINRRWDIIYIEHAVIFNRRYNNIISLLRSLNVHHACYYMRHFGSPSPWEVYVTLRLFLSETIFVRSLKNAMEPIFYSFVVLYVVIKVGALFLRPSDR